MFIQHVPVLQRLCEIEFQRHFISHSLWKSNSILWDCAYKLACSVSIYKYFRALVNFKAVFIVNPSENQTLLLWKCHNKLIERKNFEVLLHVFHTSVQCAIVIHACKSLKGFSRKNALQKLAILLSGLSPFISYGMHSIKTQGPSYNYAFMFHSKDVI